MAKTYTITGVTFDNKRVTPISCSKDPLSYARHLKQGTVWINLRTGFRYRKLKERFNNSIYDN